MPSGDTSLAIWPRIAVLALAVGSLGAAFLMKPPPVPGGPTFVSGVPLPGLCGFRSTARMPCPGCGLTRSWISAAHGRLATSAAYHRIGLPLMLYVGFQGLRQLVWLLWPGGRVRVDRGARHFDRFGLVLLALMALNWIAMLLGWLPKSFVFLPNPWS